MSERGSQVTGRQVVIIPHDAAAERQAAALAIRSASGARRLRDLLDSEEFYDPWLGRAFDAACQLSQVEDQERRLLAVAAAVDRPLICLEQLVEDQIGGPEGWATRIRAAGRRRRLMGVAAQLYALAAEGAPDQLEELVSIISADVQELAAELPPEAPPSPTTVIPRPTIGALRRATRR